MAAETTNDLMTLGGIAQATGADFFRLQRVAGQVAPSLRLNGTSYWDEAGCRRLVELANAGRPASAAPVGGEVRRA